MCKHAQAFAGMCKHFLACWQVQERASIFWHLLARIFTQQFVVVRTTSERQLQLA
jgi:hypothetical protein